MIIRTDLKRSASNLQATVYAATIFLRWTFSMLCMTAKSYHNLYLFEKVCFKSETNGFCSNHSLMVKRVNVVHDSRNLPGASMSYFCWGTKVSYVLRSCLICFCLKKIEIILCCVLVFVVRVVHLFVLKSKTSIKTNIKSKMQTWNTA